LVLVVAKIVEEWSAARLDGGHWLITVLASASVCLCRAEAWEQERNHDGAIQQ
jgi:hypothetical protein